MRHRQISLFAVCLISCLFFFFPAAVAAETTSPHLLLFLADTSGTMLDDLEAAETEATADDPNAGEDELPPRKLDLLKALMIRAGAEVPCPMGIWNTRYIAGNDRNYDIFLTPESDGDMIREDGQKRVDLIRDEFPEDYPLFNRRTPLGGLFLQLEQDRLAEFMEQESATATIVLLSDGVDSFSDFDEDAEESRKVEDRKAPAKTESRGKVQEENDEESGEKPDGPDGPMTQIRLLKKKYGDRFTLHTILVDRPDKENQEPATETGAFYKGEDSKREASGENRLRRLAWLGGGRHLVGEYLFRDQNLLTDFCGALCGGDSPAPVLAAAPAPEEKPAPKPKPEVKPKPVPVPGDADGDGVMDGDDQCPDTPTGAVVDGRGCWTLPGVLFATDKWEIRPQFAARLEQALGVLQENPNLRIRIAGHTDSRASDSYNQTLSERRAQSVLSWFAGQGIAADRMEAAGYGEQEPAADNGTKEGRRRNRRVELAPLP